MLLAEAQVACAMPHAQAPLPLAEVAPPTQAMQLVSAGPAAMAAAATARPPLGE